VSLLKLVRLFVLQNIKEEKFLTFLAILGVALGIGLFVGVKAASDRAMASFEADFRGINRSANYEILDISGIDFDEKIFPAVRSLEENSWPVLKVTGYLPNINQPINIEGIYTMKMLGLLGNKRVIPDNIEALYRNLNGVMITKKMSNTYALLSGSPIRALVYDREYSLKVIDILDTTYLRANTAVMDIGNFQEYFHKEGYVSRIDLSSDKKTAEAIQKILPQNLVIEKKEEVVKNSQFLLKSFRYNLQFISLIAVLAGIFLLYNTVFMSVIKRRTEIGILRGLGTGKKTVIMLFLIQGTLVGSLGSLLGITFGQVTAYFAVLAVDKTISTMYGAISMSDYFITPGDVLLALALGVIISLIASAVPAFEASRIRPNESYKEGSFEGRYKGYLKIFFSFGLSLAAFGGIISWVDYRFTPFDFPFLAYAGILFIILGCSLLSPSYLSVILHIFRKFSPDIFRMTGKIAMGDISGNIYRFSVALMSVAISGALVIALLTLIFSFRGSLIQWIHKNISADVYIKPSSCVSNFCFFPLSKELVKLVEGLPEVAGVDKFRTLSIDFRGRKIIAGFGDTEVQKKFAPVRNEKRTGIGKEVGISNYLSMKYGLVIGDSIELQTPKGQVKFMIRDTFSSYSTTSGFIYLDRQWLKEFWGLDDATQLGIYLKRGVDIDRFIRELEGRLLTIYSIDIMNNEELRARVLSIFNKTFAITYAIELISIVVSLIGVLNTLLSLVLEKKREMSIMRYLGGSWKQIRSTFLLSAGIIGASGILLGATMGILMSLIFINVINKVSFGWKIQFHIPILYLSLVAFILFFTTLAAGLIPSKVARKMDPKKFISFE
jgi:putative ABC transport system permease protein